MIPSKPFHGSTTEGGVCQLSDKVRELSVISETSEQVSGRYLSCVSSIIP